MPVTRSQTNASTPNSKPDEGSPRRNPDAKETKMLKRSSVCVQGIYLFLWELIAIGLVAGKAIIHNGGRKYVRLAKDPECVVRWLDITSHGSEIACCKHNVSKDQWHADICEAALSSSTKYMTTALAWLIPLVPLMLNTLFSRTSPRRVQEGQTRRLGLYLTVMVFRSVVLLGLLNRVEDFIQGQEGIECWYSDHTRTGRCRENFDFADHTVLFLSHYLAITTFEVLAVLTEQTSMLHLCCCLVPAAGIMVAALSGLYGTVAYFHSQVESIVGILLAVVTIHVPLLVIISSGAKQPWLRLRYYIAH